MWPGHTFDSPRPCSWLLCPFGSYQELSHGFLVVWKKRGFLWKGKLKVNFSAFLSKLHCSWARTALAYPRSYPFQNVDLYVTTLQVLSAVTSVCEAQGSCCVTRQVLVHQMPMFPFDISLIYIFWLTFASILSYLMSSLEFLQKSSKILK